jgi:hypothetical protein
VPLAPKTAPPSAQAPCPRGRSSSRSSSSSNSSRILQTSSCTPEALAVACPAQPHPGPPLAGPAFKLNDSNTPLSGASLSLHPLSLIDHHLPLVSASVLSLVAQWLPARRPYPPASSSDFRFPCFGGMSGLWHNTALPRDCLGLPCSGSQPTDPTPSADPLHAEQHTRQAVWDSVLAPSGGHMHPSFFGTSVTRFYNP